MSLAGQASIGVDSAQVAGATPGRGKHPAAPQGASGVEFTICPAGECAASQPVGCQEEQGTLTLQVGICSPARYVLHLSKSQQSSPSPLARTGSCTHCHHFKMCCPLPGSTMKGHPSLPNHPGTASWKLRLSFLSASSEPSLPPPPSPFPGEHGDLIPSQRLGHRDVPASLYLQSGDPCSDKLQGQNCLEVLGKIFSSDPLLPPLKAVVRDHDS